MRQVDTEIALALAVTQLIDFYVTNIALALAVTQLID